MKYYIIPKEEIVATIDSANAGDAIIEFATKMDSDMNIYFRAVTEEEYKEIRSDRNFEGAHEQFVEWAVDVLFEDFSEYDFDEEEVEDLAEYAWDINCEGDGLTEYECIERAVDEWEREDSTRFTEHVVEGIHNISASEREEDEEE